MYLHKVRRALSFFLLLALAHAGLTIPARAQAQGASPSAAALKSFPETGLQPDDPAAFVIYGVDGEVACRDASPAELRDILRLAPGVVPRQFNHLPGKSPEGDPEHLSAAAGANSVTGPGLKIILRGTAQLDQHPEAKAAFIRAAAVWESLIKNDITVVIDVDYGPTRFGNEWSSERTLGSTSSGVRWLLNYPDFRSRLLARASNASEGGLFGALPATPTLATDLGEATQVVVVSPLARVFALSSTPPHADPNATTGNDAFGSAPSIGFNSNFTFDLNPDDGIDADKTDFHAVAVHEMGHALGFTSEVGARELDPNRPIRPTVWDVFRFHPNTAQGAFHVAPRVLSSGTDAKPAHVHFDGAAEVQLSTGKPDGTGGDSRQASHWKDDSYGVPFIGIMDPTISRGRRLEVTANDRRALDFFGYLLGDAPPGPANDHFANAVGLVGLSGSAPGTNANATLEAGEPAHDPAGSVGGKSVWYRWTAPASGPATFDTQGSGFDTLLAVYTGASLGALNPTVKNDDIVAGQNRQSRVEFTAQAGVTYHVAVDGWNGEVGSLTLNWNLTAPPANQPPVAGLVAPYAHQVFAGTPSGPGTPSVQLNLSASANDPDGGVVRVDFFANNGSTNALVGSANTRVGAFFNVTWVGAAPGSYQLTAVARDQQGATGTSAPVPVTVSANPADSAQFFVAQHYRDFLNREADAGGLQFWTANITSCLDAPCAFGKRIDTSAAFFLSIEFQETGYLVYRMHKAAFGNLAGKPVPVRFDEFMADTQEIGRGVEVGVGDWFPHLEANKSSFGLAFVQRDRFRAALPEALTPTQFVERLDQNAGGVLSFDQRAALIGQLTANNTAAGRAAVLRQVADHATLRQAETRRAFVLMQYFGYLRRNPDDVGFDGQPDPNFLGFHFWLQKLDDNHGDFRAAEMVRAFIDSIEYRRRFGQ